MTRRRFTFSIRSVLMLTAVIAFIFTCISLYRSWTSSVVVAKRYVDLSTVFTDEDVELKRFLVSQIPEGVASELVDVVGKRCSGRYSPGQFVFLNEVTSDSMSVTEHGLKVFSVLIDDTIGGSKFDSIQAGQRVTISRSGRHLFSSVLVFEVDHISNRLKLVGAESVAKFFEDLKDEPRAFQIEPVGSKNSSEDSSNENTIQDGQEKGSRGQRFALRCQRRS